MKFIMFGDIMGRSGRGALRKAIPDLKEKYEPDLIIANGENIAHGKGVTEKTIRSIMDSGVDIITSGNHIFKRKDGTELIKQGKYPIIRPANYPPGVPGKGYLTTQVGTESALIINIIGRVFFAEDFDCPFRTIEEILSLKENKHVDDIIIDAHTEATSEIKALGRYFDGRVTAFIGTHTHVPTADLQILDKGSAYMSDLGMVGIKDSILGIKKEPIFNKFLTQMPSRFEIDDHGLCEVNAIFIESEEGSIKAKKVERIYTEVEV